MQIHVARPPTQLGVFSPEEIAEGLRTGRFLPTDQAWREGMSAWAPLGQWAEFAGVSAGMVSPPPIDEAPTGETALPWEQGRSLASLWKSWVMLLRSPAEALASAKLEFGPTLTLAWALAAVFSLCALFGGVVYAEQSAASMRQSGSLMVQSANQIHGPMSEAIRALGEYFARSEPKGFFAVLLQTMLLLAIGPFLHLFYGFLQWLALRFLGLCGVQSCKGLPLGRTAKAVLLALAVGNIFVMATVLLPPGGLQAVCMYLAFVPMLAIYARVVGGALRVNPWVVFASVLLFYCVFVGCAACAAVSLIAATVG